VTPRSAAAITALMLTAGLAGVASTPGRARVVAIHPAAEEVPSNLLRLYVDFSEPMAGGDVFDHVRLLEGGETVADAFRKIELWSRDETRLMLYIHPGRIKRGLVSATTMGPVLVEGRRYVLEILPGLKSRRGGRAGRATKGLRAVAADRTMPDPARWRATRVGIELDEWLDHAGLEEYVMVEGVGFRVEGRRLLFDRPMAGTVRVTVDRRLEDLCGNSLRRPFETRPDVPEAAEGVVERLFAIP
jgi:hypothetical protein